MSRPNKGLTDAIRAALSEHPQTAWDIARQTAWRATPKGVHTRLLSLERRGEAMRVGTVTGEGRTGFTRTKILWVRP